MRIEVDSCGWTFAVDEFYGANRGVVDAVAQLSGALGGSGSMAGSDSGGQDRAEQYDAVAGPLLEAGAQRGGVLAQLANLSNAAGDPMPNTLSEGDIVDRFGPPSGDFAAPDGAAYGERALPPSSIGREQYEVVRPLPEGVTQGRIAPWFEQPGGGLQYHFDRPVSRYVEQGFLRPGT